MKTLVTQFLGANKAKIISTIVDGKQVAFV